MITLKVLIIIYVRILYSNADKMKPLVHSFHFSPSYTHIFFGLLISVFKVSMQHKSVCMYIKSMFVYTQNIVWPAYKNQGNLLCGYMQSKHDRFPHVQHTTFNIVLSVLKLNLYTLMEFHVYLKSQD